MKVEACPKCGTGRESHRWPFCITAGSGPDEFKLQVECGRCGYYWIEPSLDAGERDEQTDE